MTTGEGVKHSPVLSTLFRMMDDNELEGASEFIKGNLSFKNIFTVN